MKYLSILIILILVFGCTTQLPPLNKTNYTIACTQEAKLCSDGSAVGRTGPNCEFAACPNSITSDENQTQVLKTFELDKSFTISENETLTNQAEDITIKAVSFTSSLCPADVICIWSGELGVNLEVNNETVYLGDVTRKTVNVSSYQIDLLSIDYESKKADIVISKTSESKVWFLISPVQCGTNNWQTWNSEMNYSSEEVRIIAWLSNQSIVVYNLRHRETDEMVCLSCSCPRGDRVAILVSPSDNVRLETLGWTELGSLACTKDAKVCSDGSIVGRTAPFCEFENCSG
ncbi:MAG: hypothetical protein Q7S22_04670 [Candidatus Micrarchaeota archaeon]|nr:hypothetical protein [Candidatus Micrarchaeota archaeon]